MRSALAVTVWLALSGTAGAAPVVVLDPGHGGTNTGACSPALGRCEKELTLELARAAARYLAQWVPSVEVALTRTRDEYLTLNQRVRKANSLGATLFVSLHGNASPARAEQGFETFILTRRASDQEAGRISLQERPVVASILSDLQLVAAHGDSARLAERVQRRLGAVRGRERSRGVRQAPFDVLLGLRMPGVLVEVGFVDHPLEGRELAQAAVVEGIAIAVAAALVEQLQDDPATVISRR